MTLLLLMATRKLMSNEVVFIMAAVNIVIVTVTELVMEAIVV